MVVGCVCVWTSYYLIFLDSLIWRAGFPKIVLYKMQPGTRFFNRKLPMGSIILIKTANPTTTVSRCYLSAT